jgi:uncharacterized protein (TIGR03435 family)
MLRRLIADRFGVVVHDDTRDLPVFVLRIARADGRLGARMRPSTVDCGSLAVAAARAPCGLDVRFAAGSVTGIGVSMAQFARNLVGAAGRTVVDRTGLTGGYDFDLTFAPDSAATAGPPVDPAAPTLFTAIQDQLGLKLEPGRAPVAVLVIDRASRPVPD